MAVRAELKNWTQHRPMDGITTKNMLSLKDILEWIFTERVLELVSDPDFLFFYLLCGNKQKYYLQNKLCFTAF